MKNYEKHDLSKMEFSSTTGYNMVEQYHVRYCGKTIYAKKPETPLFTYGILKDFANWLNSEAEILDEKEKEYLSAVIKPFRDDVSSISKQKVGADEEYIKVTFRVMFGKYHNWATELQPFKKGKMYKGMEARKFYTLEELGL